MDCSGEQAWAHGNSLVNYMKMVEFVGLSGKIEFDTSGLRTQFEMDLMELQMEGLVRAGGWRGSQQEENGEEVSRRRMEKMEGK